MSADLHTRIIVSARDNASGTFRKVSLEAEALKNRLTSMQGVVAGGLGTIGVGLGVAETLRETARFETALADMGKVTDRAFGEIKAEIMALPPELGSATELMEGYYQTMSAGVTEPVAAMDMLVVASKAAKGAHVQQGEVIKALTKTMTGFAGELTSAAEASDLLFAIEKDGQTTVAELVPHIGSLAALSREVGVAATEMGGGLAQITQTAGSTSDAATQLKAILVGLYKPTEEMAKILKRMGYDSGQALVADKGFVGALQALREAADKAGRPLAKLFESSEALIGIASLAANGFAGVTEKIRSMENAAGMTDKAYSDYKETLQGVWDTAQNTVGQFALKFGSEWSPAVKRAVEDTQQWLRGHDADIAEWARKSGEGLEITAQAARNLIDVYNALPAEITGPAGTGLIARMIFGSWQPALIVSTITALSASMDSLNKSAGANLPSLSNMLNNIQESGRNFQNVYDVLSGKRDWNTGNLLTGGGGSMLSAHGGAGAMLPAHGDGASLAQAAQRATPAVTLSPDADSTDKLDAAMKRLRSTLADLTKTDADLKLARLREEYADLKKVVGDGNPQLAELRDLMAEIERTGLSPAERKRNERDFDKELSVLRAEAQVLEMERGLAITGGGRKQSDAQVQAAIERAKLEQQATEWRGKGIDEDRIAERLRLSGLKVEADARKKNSEITVQFERAYRETVLGTSEAKLAAIREEADAYIAAGADRIRVEEWVREQTLRISRSGSDGAVRALRNYHDAATDMGRGMEQLVGSTFSGIENSFSLTTKGMSVNWSNMVDGMLNDLMRLTLRQSITGPLASALGKWVGGMFGAGLGGSGDTAVGSMNIDGGLGEWAIGGAFDGSRGLSAYSGSVVEKPTLFAFARGAGIMGEAGPEGIFPLRRGRDGKLGVRAELPQTRQDMNLKIELVNQSGQPMKVARQETRMDGEVMVAQLFLSALSNDTCGLATKMQNQRG